MRKKYVSPLFEEVVLMTEDVLSESGPIADSDNMGNDEIDDGFGKPDDNFNF